MKVLIVDGFNLFIRNYSANPLFNYRGQHIGGIVGSFMQVRNAIDILGIDILIFVFDGDDSQNKRKKIYPQYKANRKQKPIKFKVPPQLSGIEINYQRSMAEQLNVFINNLQNIPCRVLMVNNCQGDDVISYSTTLLKNSNVVYLMSNDKDFFQLLDQNVHIWNQTKKQLYTLKSFKSQYDINVKNFTQYRAIQGDTSDNIHGVNGFGQKTIIKMFKQTLQSDETATYEKLLEQISKKDTGKKMVNKFIGGKDVYERNMRIMSLDNDQILSAAAKSSILRIIYDVKPFTLSEFNLQINLAKCGALSAIKNFNWFIQPFKWINFKVSTLKR